MTQEGGPIEVPPERRVDGPEGPRQDGLLYGWWRLMEAIWRSETPFIAAVNGPAVGGGCQLALACDLVLAADEATFWEIFTKRGLPLEGGGAWLLTRSISLPRAKELALFGDPLPAAEAERWGLVNRMRPGRRARGHRARLGEAARVGPAHRSHQGPAQRRVGADDAAVLRDRGDAARPRRAAAARAQRAGPLEAVGERPPPLGREGGVPQHPLDPGAVLEVHVGHREVRVVTVTPAGSGHRPRSTRRRGPRPTSSTRRYQPVRPLRRIRAWMSGRLRCSASLKHGHRGWHTSSTASPQRHTSPMRTSLLVHADGREVLAERCRAEVLLELLAPRRGGARTGTRRPPCRRRRAR